jgi:Nif-specific regulatory protein
MAPDAEPMTPEVERRLRLLHELGCAFAARTDLDDLIAFVIEKCRDVLDSEGASILVHDEESGELYFPYVVASDAAVAAELARLRFPADRGVAGAVLRSGQPMVVNDAENDPRIYRAVDDRTGVRTHSILCVPLRTPQGVIGVLQAVNRRGGQSFSEDDRSFLEGLAGSVAISLENARLYAALRASEGRLRTEVGVLRRDLARSDRFSEIVGTSPAMAEVFRLMESAAAAPISVLIEGETGTGKELVARAIHASGPRATAPFIAVNCAALPETLLESELFGHRRGAFTGALADRVGLFEAARGGAIFLDEVGDMPAVMQAKLLRVLQEGEVVPVGDNRPRKVDVRVISATNRDLAGEVAAGRFRQDLYYRLAAFPIRVPPLRARSTDVAVIAVRMLEKTATRYRKRVAVIETDAVALLTAYGWPGNVRELQNEIERATALARDGEAIGVEHLSARLREQGKPAGLAQHDGALALDRADGSGRLPASGGSVERDLRGARAAWEATFLREALEASGGNVTRAAQALGLSRVALQKKMKEYGLRDP